MLLYNQNHNISRAFLLEVQIPQAIAPMFQTHITSLEIPPGTATHSYAIEMHSFWVWFLSNQSRIRWRDNTWWQWTCQVGMKCNTVKLKEHLANTMFVSSEGGRKATKNLWKGYLIVWSLNIWTFCAGSFNISALAFWDAGSSFADRGRDSNALKHQLASQSVSDLYLYLYLKEIAIHWRTNKHFFMVAFLVCLRHLWYFLCAYFETH